MTAPATELLPIDKYEALVILDLWRAAMRGGQVITLGPRGVTFLENLVEWIMADELEGGKPCKN